MASLTFFGLRILVGASGLVLFAVDWRLSVVAWAALALDFLTLLWMVLPLSSLWYVGAALVLVGLVLGLALGLGRPARPSWQPAAVLAAILALLRGSYILTGLVTGRVSKEALVAAIPAGAVLVCAPSCGLWLGSAALRAVRSLRGPRS